MGYKTSQKQDLLIFSTKVANLGLKRMLRHDLIGAVDCFHKALYYNPTNYAHYLNRSYCYLMANKNTLALNDAKYVLERTKNQRYIFIAHLRAGMALRALKEYQNAEAYLKQAINIYSDNHYAKRELLRVQIAQLVQMGFSERDSILALQMHPSTLDAMDYLANHSKCNFEDDFGNFNNNYDDYVYSSDEDGTVSNTDLVNAMLNYTPGVTKLEPVTAQTKC